MNNLQIFNYKGKDIRTIKKDGSIWWVLKDVCVTLDIGQPIRVAKRLDKDEVTLIHLIDRLGRKQNTYVVNESGLYNVILRSDKEEAKPFQKWVTSEVLPSIRKHGAYITDDALEQIINNPDFGIRLLTELKTEKEKCINLEKENAEKIKEITELKPKAEYHDRVLNKDDLFSITFIAKDLGLSSAAKLNKILNFNKIIFKDKTGAWHPYSNYEWLITENYCDYVSYPIAGVPILKWTEKGRKWIVENFEKWKKKLEAVEKSIREPQKLKG